LLVGHDNSFFTHGSFSCETFSDFICFVKGQALFASELILSKFVPGQHKSSVLFSLFFCSVLTEEGTNDTVDACDM
jgi:hypothetical protein